VGTVFLEFVVLVAGFAVVVLAFLMLEPESEGRLSEGARRRLRGGR